MSDPAALFDQFIIALAMASDLHDEHSRAKAYLDAKIDLKAFPLDQIREADQLAMHVELNRRISRS